jgi:hypothetical protein
LTVRKPRLDLFAFPQGTVRDAGDYPKVACLRSVRGFEQIEYRFSDG